MDMARSESGSMAMAAASSAGPTAPYHGPPRHPRPPRRPRGPDATFETHPRQEYAFASQYPVSTFSLDVDTTSYKIALGWTRQGIRIDRDSVRAEEWVNALHYGYAPPRGEEKFAITSGLYPHPLGGDRRVARITTKAPETTGDVPLNVTLVLDASGSMAEGNRVDIARRAAETIRRNLDEKDRIAVVHFTTSVVPELTVGHTHSNSHTVMRSIEALIPRGSTNVQAGLNLGVSLADQARTERPEAHNYVILMSDGVANVDATNPFAILETAHDENAKNPLRLITIGVGISNYNDPLLETLAQHGNGWYRYLTGTGDAEETFRKENWLALSTPFAGQTRAQVTWNPETVDRWRIIGYENRVTSDESFAEDRKEFAEIHAGAETTVLYELELNREADPREFLDLGSIELRWVDPGTGESRSQTAELTGRAGAQYKGPEGERALISAVTAVFADIYGAKPEGSRAGREELWELEMLAGQLMRLKDRSPRMQEHQDLLFGVINHMKHRKRGAWECRWDGACPYPYPDCTTGIPGPCVGAAHPPQLCLGPAGPCHREE
jgi:Ca-activated chloride channel family protein